MLTALSQALGRRFTQEAEVWTTERELLAITVELLHQLILITLAANGSKSVKSTTPLHIPRPWETGEKKDSESPITIRDFARRLKKG